MKPPAGDFMDRFRQEVEREAGGRWLTSPLAEWMETHHDQAAELLAHDGMNWGKAAEAFTAFGLKDQTGKPPTPETARETWLRVEARRRAGLRLRKSP